MRTLEIREARKQSPLPVAPYDRWITPDGEETAQFHRVPEGFLLRFPGHADFLVPHGPLPVPCWPIPGSDRAHIDHLFENSVLPLIGNHAGGLFMHGSAVAIGDKAVAFLGLSRRGKTTLAGAFARAGHPFLAEDMLALEATASGYDLLPGKGVLRLFADSADHLLGHPSGGDTDGKALLEASTKLPHRRAKMPLSAMFVLGPGDVEGVQVDALAPAEALAQIIPHSFILDVEDRLRLRAHFDRVGALAEAVPCLALDYPRRFSELEGVISAVIARMPK